MTWRTLTKTKSKFHRGMSEKLLRVLASQSKSAFQNLSKPLIVFRAVSYELGHARHS